MDIHVMQNHSRMSDKLLKIFFVVETTHWWWVGRKNIIKKVFSKYLEKKEYTILDGGCGTGAGILFLQNYGKVYGVDLSKEATNFCKKRGLKRIKTADVSKLPYKNNFFDLVCLMDVIEHIKDDKMVVQEVFRVLKPGGFFLVTVPALPFIYSAHDKDQGHFRRYTKKSLEDLLKSTSFKKIRTTYFNILLSLPIVFIRLLSRLGGPVGKLADFDSKLNYDISKSKKINFFLSKIFSFEGVYIQHQDIPFGVSLLSLVRKPKK